MTNTYKPVGKKTLTRPVVFCVGAGLAGPSNPKGITMFKRNHLVRSTLTVAMLSAAVLAQSAHAGLLGGGGGLNGGLNGGFGPRGLDVGGSASGQGQITRNGAPLPRPASVVNKAAEAGQTTDSAVRQSATATTAAGVNAAASGQAAAAAQAGAARSGAAAMGANATSAANASAATAGQAATTAPSTATRSAGSATLDGAARASRGDGSVAADASAQGAVSR